MKRTDTPVVAAAEARLRAAVTELREACHLQTQWLRAKIRVELAAELAAALSVQEQAWTNLLTLVRARRRPKVAANLENAARAYLPEIGRFSAKKRAAKKRKRVRR